MPLTKKDLKQIKDVVVEATEPYFTAIKEDFNNIDENFAENRKDHEEINLKLGSLERRVICIEDVITKHTKEIKGIRTTLAKHSRILNKNSRLFANHSKELKEIKKDLKELKSQKEPLEERVALLEEKVARLEVQIQL